MFSAGNTATGSFTVSVSNPVQLKGLRFEEGIITVSGAVANAYPGLTTVSRRAP